MVSLRNTFLATALAAAPFAFAGQAAEASTVTGAITHASKADVYGTLDGTGAWTLVFDGSFSVTGGLSSYLEEADDWQMDGVLDSPLTGMETQTETWGSPISAMGLMAANIPYSSQFLFTLFANSMALSYEALSGNTDGSYTFGGGWGLLPGGDMAEWEFTNLSDSSTGAGPGELDITGDFVFTLSGSDVGATLDSISTFLFGTTFPTEAVLASLPSGVVPVELSLTLSPLSTTPHPIPLPAALPLLAGGVALFGLIGWRRRQA